MLNGVVTLKKREFLDPCLLDELLASLIEVWVTRLLKRRREPILLQDHRP